MTLYYKCYYVNHNDIIFDITSYHILYYVNNAIYCYNVEIYMI